ncbi:MAG: MBL fold metallo-hydrolase [Chloroflexi bacterium]|nr:MBL fold metallo-hydrolase [Chloroflexota bacterium]MDA1147059.1 MBL fold metallo-hydrolase [Chloroflexota bacterium]
MAEPVIDGVWRLRSIPGANCYLLTLDEGGYALVDAGTPRAAPVIAAALERLGVTPSMLLLTHRHWDHAGGASELRARLGLRVVAGAGDVADGRIRADQKPPRWLQRVMHRGGPLPHPAAVDQPVSMEHDTEVSPGIWAIPSPGHTSGSLCFLLPARALIFVGDLTLNSGDRLSRPLPMANDDTAMQERSLASIAARAPSHGAPGHGAPLTEVFGDWIRKLAGMPPAPGPSVLRVLRNPRAAARFVGRMRGQ